MRAKWFLMVTWQSGSPRTLFIAGSRVFCLARQVPLGAHKFLHILRVSCYYTVSTSWKCKWTSAYATLPTQQKSTLLSRVSTHTSVDCEISGRQPTRLFKEFPRIHIIMHCIQKKRCSHETNEDTLYFTYQSLLSCPSIPLHHLIIRCCSPLRKFQQTPGTYPRPLNHLFMKEILPSLYFGVPWVYSTGLLEFP